ncbi:hypothetical protein SAMN06265350_101146 [Solitalea koreensis]|uniref:Uncharacterized protein n=1 Tax=Solitalea koreensis TaxID=543615 RepID=A0A521AGQ8_9SPHI|nr:hypothetical protein SAMN06265350_101146 [Solitalea koreensis]
MDDRVHMAFIKQIDQKRYEEVIGNIKTLSLFNL